jgi:WD40 repeat protein
MTPSYFDAFLHPFFGSNSGALRVLSSNNDCIVRVFDGGSFATLARFPFPWAVNHTSVSPDGKLVCVVGDDPEGMVADFQTGKPIASLKGHLDFSFATAWHPDGRIFATGNQDTTTRWVLLSLKPGDMFSVPDSCVHILVQCRFTSASVHVVLLEL